MSGITDARWRWFRGRSSELLAGSCDRGLELESRLKRTGSLPLSCRKARIVFGGKDELRHKKKPSHPVNGHVLLR